MEQSTQQRTMAATRWLLLLLCIAAAGGMLGARAQPDNKGFISIDCGLSEEIGFVDNTTKLSYAPDAGFVDAGTNHIISPEYVTNVSSSLAKNWYSLRSFTAGTRNCYTLRSLMPGLKYLIRGKFMYGNYDGLDKPPMFDLSYRGQLLAHSELLKLSDNDISGGHHFCAKRLRAGLPG
uniref:Malectin-like domain-containing protein n=1 Tax=Triticum urartu TaxID=4572 RepID=A0A8R7K3M4_TRIUA